MNIELRNKIESLKRKLIRVKEWAKKCKKFISKYGQKGKNISTDENFLNIMKDSKSLCKKCIYFLK